MRFCLFLSKQTIIFALKIATYWDYDSTGSWLQHKEQTQKTGN